MGRRNNRREYCPEDFEYTAEDRFRYARLKTKKRRRNSRDRDAYNPRDIAILGGDPTP